MALSSTTSVAVHEMAWMMIYYYHQCQQARLTDLYTITGAICRQRERTPVSPYDKL